MVEDSRADRPDQPTLGRAQPAGAQNDQLGVLLLGLVQDRRRRVTALQHERGRETWAGEGALGLLDLAPTLFLLRLGGKRARVSVQGNALRDADDRHAISLADELDHHLERTLRAFGSVVCEQNLHGGTSVDDPTRRCIGGYADSCSAKARASSDGRVSDGRDAPAGIH